MSRRCDCNRVLSSRYRWCSRDQRAQAGRAAAAKSAGGWTLPPTAETKRTRLPVDAEAAGDRQVVFKKKCQKCHGPGGKGDGPDADPDARQDMDLTVASRAAKNPDGVVFYKVWNGRKKPKMPAQKDDLTKDQVWAVVAYVQTLRKPKKGSRRNGLPVPMSLTSIRVIHSPIR